METSGTLEEATPPVPGDAMACPGCRMGRITPRRDIDGVTFTCARCRAAWRVELGYVRRVRTSDDCPRR